VQALVARAVSEFGRLDVMHNNAGVSTPRPGLSFVDHTQADWDRLLGINLMGMVYGCKHAVLQFREQGGGGAIVNTCSVAGMVAMTSGNSCVPAATDGPAAISGDEAVAARDAMNPRRLISVPCSRQRSAG